MSKAGRIGVASKGVSVVDGKKVANLLLSITGDTLPDGSEDIDLQREVTDFEASASAAKAWIGAGGRVKFDHIPGEAGYIGSAVKAFADASAREVFGHVQIADPIIVRMVERGVPFQASWHGPYTETPSAEKAADGKPVTRVYPIAWDEVSLILQDFPGAARKRSKLIAAKSAAPMEEEHGMDRVTAIMEMVANLSPEEKAELLAKFKSEEPKGEPGPPPEPPIGAKAASDLIDFKIAPVLEAVAKLSGELKAGLELATAKIGEKAASGLDAAKFDSALGALASRTETIDKGVTGIRELMAKTPQTVVMPATRDVGSKSVGDAFGDRTFGTRDEVTAFADDLASMAGTEDERRRILAAKNRRIVEMSRS